MPTDTAVAAEITGLRTWVAPAADLAAAIARPVLAAIDELGVIEVTGADAGAFVQAQLTNDSAAAGLGVARNGYCTAKGRLLAVFDHWSEGESHFLQLPREILPPVLKRLSMFVLRAKAKLSDASANWTSFGLIGPGSIAALERAALPVPDAGATARAGELRIWRQPEGTRLAERFMLITPRAGALSLAGQLASVRTAASGVWWWSQIDAGVPTIVAATQEKFVPQMVNLEVLGGVNFRKGCYPGQEVVARSQYLGKLRRRMHLAHTPGTTLAGADVYAGGESQPVGTVVLAAAAPGGGTDVLFECPIDAAERPLQVSAGGAALTQRALPYAIVDVTA
jgi:folate-binding protein YgfZ